MDFYNAPDFGKTAEYQGHQYSLGWRNFSRLKEIYLRDLSLPEKDLVSMITDTNEYFRSEEALGKLQTNPSWSHSTEDALLRMISSDMSPISRFKLGGTGNIVSILFERKTPGLAKALGERLQLEPLKAQDEATPHFPPGKEVEWLFRFQPEEFLPYLEKNPNILISVALNDYDSQTALKAISILKWTPELAKKITDGLRLIPDRKLPQWAEDMNSITNGSTHYDPVVFPDHLIEQNARGVLNTFDFLKERKTSGIGSVLAEYLSKAPIDRLTVMSYPSYDLKIGDFLSRIEAEDDPSAIPFLEEYQEKQLRRDKQVDAVIEKLRKN